MIDTPPHPTPAMIETPSATYRKGQMSVVVKVIIGALIFLQAISVPIIGYLLGKWDAMQAIIAMQREDIAVLKTKAEQFERFSQRFEEKLDRLLQDHRP